MITALRRQNQRTTGAGEKHEQNKEAAEFQETKFFKVRKRKRKKKSLGFCWKKKGDGENSTLHTAIKKGSPWF